MAYARLAALSERQRLAALEWLGKDLVYATDGFGQKAQAGGGLLLWNEAWQRLAPKLRTDYLADSSLTDQQRQERLARWETGLRTLVGDLGYGFGLETTNSEGFYAIRLEPLPGSPNPPLLLVRGTEPAAKGDGDLLPPDILTDAHPLNIGFNQLYSNSTRTAADLQAPVLRTEIQALLSWAATWDQQQDRPIVLVAHSLGGALAQLLQVELARAGTEIEQLVAFNSPGLHQQLLNRVALSQLQSLRRRTNTYFVNDGDFVQIAGQVVVPGDVYAVAFRSQGTLNGVRQPLPWHPDGILGRHLPTVLDAAGWGGVQVGVEPLPGLKISDKSSSIFYGSYLFNYLAELAKDGDYFLGFQSYIILGELLARSTASGLGQLVSPAAIKAVQDWRLEAEATIKADPILNAAHNAYAGRSLAFETLDAMGRLLVNMPQGIGGLLTFRGTTEWARSVAGENLFGLMNLIPRGKTERLRYVAEMAVLIEKGLNALLRQTPEILDYLYNSIADAIARSTQFVASGGLQAFATQASDRMLQAAAALGSDLQQLYQNLPSEMQQLFLRAADGIRTALDSLPLINGRLPDLAPLQRQILQALEQFQEILIQTVRAGNEELLEEALYVALASNGVPLADRNRDQLVNRQDVDLSVDANNALHLTFAVGGQLSSSLVSFGEQSSTPLGTLSLSGGLDGAIGYQLNLDIGLGADGSFSLNQGVSNDIELTALLAPAPATAFQATAGPFGLNLSDRGSGVAAALSIDLRGLNATPLIQGEVAARLAVDYAASTALPEWSLAGQSIRLQGPGFAGNLDLSWNASAQLWDGSIAPLNGPRLNVSELSGSGLSWPQLLPLLSGDPTGMIGGAVQRYLDGFSRDLIEQLRQVPLFDLIGTNLPGFSDVGSLLDYVLKAISDISALASNPQTEKILEDIIASLLDQSGFRGLYSGLDVKLGAGGIELAITINPRWSWEVPLQQDFGFDSLGLNLSGDIKINAVSTLTPSLSLTLGVDVNGRVYVDTSRPNEFSLTADVAIPDASFSANLGVYGLSAQDQGSFLRGTFALDLKDSATDQDQRWQPGEAISVDADVDLDAQLALRLEASVLDPQLPLPEIRGDLRIASVDGSQLSDWRIDLNNPAVNLGGFSDYIKPVSDQIATTLAPFQPILSVLGFKPVEQLLNAITNTSQEPPQNIFEQFWNWITQTTSPLPYAANWAKENLGSWTKINIAYILDVISQYQQLGQDPSQLAGILTTSPAAAIDNPNFKISRAWHVLDALDQIVDTFVVDIGADPNGWLQLNTGFAIPSMAQLTAGADAEQLSIDRLVRERIQNSLADPKQIFANLFPAPTTTRPEKFGVQLGVPLKENPASLFGLLFGQPVDLLTVDLEIPGISLGVSTPAFDFPIIPVLGIFGYVKGGFSFDLSLGNPNKPEFGIDTFGLQAYTRGIDGYTLADAVKDGVYALAGADLIRLNANIGSDLGVYFGIPQTQLQLRAGVNPNLDFDFNAGLQDSDGDGKFRFTDWNSQNIFSNFYADAQLDLDLNAFIGIGDWKASLTLATLNLLNWSSVQSGATSFNAPAKADPPPALAVSNQLVAFEGSSLRLLAGPAASEALLVYESTGRNLLDEADSILLEALTNNSIRITINDFSQVVSSEGLQTIVINSGALSDNLWVDPAIPLTIRVETDAANLLPGDDVVETGSGNDLVLAGEGKDSLRGGAGSDTLRGGGDRDLIDGGEGDDQLFGDQGADLLYGGAGADRIFPGQGNDTVDAEDGNDLVLDDGETTDEPSNDLLAGGAGDDTMAAGLGADTLLGGNGNDSLLGDADDDLLAGGTGRDTLHGGSGRDLLYGGEGNDSLFGDHDDDVLDGGNGNDQLEGGDGNDRFIVSLGTDRYDASSDLQPSIDLLDGSNSASGLFISFDSEVISGSNRQGRLYSGYSGEDPAAFRTARTQAGDPGSILLGFEAVRGSEFSDVIDAGVRSAAAGGLLFRSSAGDDVLLGSNQNDLFQLNTWLGWQQIHGRDGSDQLEVNTQLPASAGNIFFDGLSVSSFSTEFRPWLGDRPISELPQQQPIDLEERALIASIEQIRTGAGNDALIIHPESDVYFQNLYLGGGDGDDILMGGLGLNILDGGTGTNTYVINKPTDRIIDSGSGSTLISSISIDLSQTTNSLGQPSDLRSIANLVLVNDDPSIQLVAHDNALSNQIRGSRLGDRLTISSGADTVQAGDGDDTIVVLDLPYGGLIDGGQGYDILDLRSVLDSYAIDASTGRITGNITFSGIEEIILGDGAITYRGSESSAIKLNALYRNWTAAGFNLGYILDVESPSANDRLIVDFSTLEANIPAGNRLGWRTWARVNARLVPTDGLLPYDQDYGWLSTAKGNEYRTNINITYPIRREYEDGFTYEIPSTRVPILAYSGIPLIVQGGPLAQALVGTTAADEITGGLGHDEIWSLGGFDVIDGKQGIDLLDLLDFSSSPASVLIQYEKQDTRLSASNLPANPATINELDPAIYGNSLITNVEVFGRFLLGATDDRVDLSQYLNLYLNRYQAEKLQMLGFDGQNNWASAYLSSDPRLRIYSGAGNDWVSPGLSVGEIHDNLVDLGTGTDTLVLDFSTLDTSGLTYRYPNRSGITSQFNAVTTPSYSTSNEPTIEWQFPIDSDTAAEMLIGQGGLPDPSAQLPGSIELPQYFYSERPSGLRISGKGVHFERLHQIGTQYSDKLTISFGTDKIEARGGNDYINYGGISYGYYVADTATAEALQLEDEIDGGPGFDTFAFDLNLQNLTSRVSIKNDGSPHAFALPNNKRLRLNSIENFGAILLPEGLGGDIEYQLYRGIPLFSDNYSWPIGRQLSGSSAADSFQIKLLGQRVDAKPENQATYPLDPLLTADPRQRAVNISVDAYQFEAKAGHDLFRLDASELGHGSTVVNQELLSSLGMAPLGIRLGLATYYTSQSIPFRDQQDRGSTASLAVSDLAHLEDIGWTTYGYPGSTSFDYKHWSFEYSGVDASHISGSQFDDEIPGTQGDDELLGNHGDDTFFNVMLGWGYANLSVPLPWRSTASAADYEQTKSDLIFNLGADSIDGGVGLDALELLDLRGTGKGWLISGDGSAITASRGGSQSRYSNIETYNTILLSGNFPDVVDQTGYRVPTRRGWNLGFEIPYVLLGGGDDIYRFSSADLRSYTRVLDGEQGDDLLEIDFTAIQLPPTDRDLRILFAESFDDQGAFRSININYQSQFYGPGSPFEQAWQSLSYRDFERLSIKASSGSDLLKGFGGNDLFYGLAGNDSIDGAAGIDTAVYAGTKTDYSVEQINEYNPSIGAYAPVAGAYILRGPAEKYDTLRNIEYLRFEGSSSSVTVSIGDFLNDPGPVGSVRLSLVEDTGLPNDRLTSNPLVRVLDLLPGASWQYSIDGGQFWTDGNGDSFELPTSIYAAGDVQVRQSLDGRTGSPNTSFGAVVIDQNPPLAPFVFLAADTGPSSTDRITANPTLRLAWLENDSSWQYSIDRGSTWQQGSGESFSLPDGSYAAGQVQVRQSDAAGNLSPDTTAVAAFTIDRVAAPPQLSLVADTGTSSSDRITSNPTIRVQNLEAGARWQLSSDSGSTWRDGTGDSFVLPVGVYATGQVQVRQSDLAGTTSSANTGFTGFTIQAGDGDGFVPGPLTIGAVSLGTTQQGYALRNGNATPLQIRSSANKFVSPPTGKGLIAIAAAASSGNGFDLYWRNTGNGQFVRWALNAAGQQVGSAVVLSPADLLTAESRLNADLNTDGTTGLVFTPLPLTIEGVTLGVTQLGYAIRNGNAAPLQITGTNGKTVLPPTTAGKGLSAFAAFATSGGGYELYWKNSANGAISRWTVNASGKQTGQTVFSKTTLPLAELQRRFDLSGDGRLGPFSAQRGTAGPDSLTGRPLTVTLGFAGDDSLTSGTASSSSTAPDLLIGGRGADGYLIPAGNFSIVADLAGSDNDVLESPGLRFTGTSTQAATLEAGRHLLLYDNTTNTRVMVLNWQTASGRIESFRFAGETVGFDQLRQRLRPSPLPDLSLSKGLSTIKSRGILSSSGLATAAGIDALLEAYAAVDTAGLL